MVQKDQVSDIDRERQPNSDHNMNRYTAVERERRSNAAYIEIHKNEAISKTTTTKKLNKNLPSNKPISNLISVQSTFGSPDEFTSTIQKGNKAV